MEIEPFKQVLKDTGFNSHEIQHLSVVAQDYRDGVFVGTKRSVEKLKGKSHAQWSSNCAV